MDLRKLSNQQILFDLKELVNQEREMLVVIVSYLAEVERRKIHWEEGYPSAFEYCMKVLRYSESESISRIRAARLVLEFPFVMDALQDGRLSLSVASRAEACFRRERKSGMGRGPKEMILRELFDQKLKEADRILATNFPKMPSSERKIPLDSDLTKLEFTIPRGTLEKMENILSLRSHKNPAKRLDLMLEDLVSLGLKHWDPAYPRPPKKRTIVGACQ